MATPATKKVVEHINSLPVGTEFTPQELSKTLEDVPQASAYGACVKMFKDGLLERKQVRVEKQRGKATNVYIKKVAPVVAEAVSETAAT